MKAVWKGALPRLIAGTAIIAMGTATLVSGGATQAAAASKVTISVAYAANTTFDTTPLGLTWWTAVKKQYEKLYPNVTVNLIAVQGGEPDFLTKLALDYHTTSTSPTLAQFPSTEIALYQSSGWLASLSPFLKGSSWFKQYPKVIQNEGLIDGKIYAVSSGENNVGLYYDKAILTRRGSLCRGSRRTGPTSSVRPRRSRRPNRRSSRCGWTPERAPDPMVPAMAS